MPGKSAAPAPATIRLAYRFTGIVQGVGFRPFLYRLARERSLAGFVQNRTDGVIAEVEGSPEAVRRFGEDALGTLPPLADVTSVTSREVIPLGDPDFRIAPSADAGRAEVRLSPDVAPCPACLAEMDDPEDRRYRYPFINCTDCGPRLTIIRDIPYDRENTSMACFPLCPSCRREYEDPLDRRFHAEPNACTTCGPTLRLLDGEGNPVASGSEIERAIDLLKDGRILAVKGLGGFHLGVDGKNEEAVARLRLRKYREEKPLAILVRDLMEARRLADLRPEEERLLTSPERPIVLVRKHPDIPLAPSVAPGMATLGIMLPSTPLQHLLLKGDFPALVMTSGNQTDEPICIGNREALARLRGIADFFLVHDRDILVRCDDSIAMVAAGGPAVQRRARGYAPRAVALRRRYPSVLALGPQVKATVCIIREDAAFLSPHIGDLETPQARDFHEESVALVRRITESDPDRIACDLHPGYHTSRIAAGLTDRQVYRVQHHHAHIVSCLAENRAGGPVIGLAMDGTGYGVDGQAWGGEFLVATETDFTRAGHLKPFSLPGGEKAIREPWRTAVSLLREAFGSSWPEAARRAGILPEDTSTDLLERIMDSGLAGLKTTSLGRVFDGVSALLGPRYRVSFEGQAAMELEALAGSAEGRLLPFTIGEDNGTYVLDLFPAVRALADLLPWGESPTALAAAFHRTLAVSFTALADRIRETTGLNTAALSGGCFQNRRLLEETTASLEGAGFEVLRHRLAPANDGGIALGQAVIAAAQALNEAEQK
ncbi:MAG: carbamoyltransferase HypF [Deltaproteobacteria bacterium HGW-Deltaproteobacteria-19]|jgi:hydrogenase maturation protein HypF|nr:MAG: carbamoyltransferase HypF [Deltaproteobacteria bacterium HGW-Deltaproteobacteria-19]